MISNMFSYIFNIQKIGKIFYNNICHVHVDDNAVLLKCIWSEKFGFHIFEVCHLNNHSPRNEINVVCTFRCTPAYVISHSNRQQKCLQKRISHGRRWELIIRRLCTRLTWNFQWMLPLCLFIQTRKLTKNFSLHIDTLSFTK